MKQQAKVLQLHIKKSNNNFLGKIDNIVSQTVDQVIIFQSSRQGGFAKKKKK
jgi:hypothetical protein